jgi:hypothetical protein
MVEKKDEERGEGRNYSILFSFMYLEDGCSVLLLWYLPSRLQKITI